MNKKWIETTYYNPVYIKNVELTNIDNSYS